MKEQVNFHNFPTHPSRKGKSNLIILTTVYQKITSS